MGVRRNPRGSLFLQPEHSAIEQSEDLFMASVAL